MTSNQSGRSDNSNTNASADQANAGRTNGDRHQTQGSTQGDSELVSEASVPVGTLRVSNGRVTGEEYQEYYEYSQSDKKPNGTQ
ncbi:uncharacterized protein SETTUDRAFT_166726 [Exserohilum turcica Et28A]|uniref:Uncharacterized protein n=1 Tax=Exserohilum turcicum (strain 28A) TaxID=671987 RepID=R0J1K3_EXST2|nr:uncharacterized protein SETTUDRAFT_166726 [Exserohilum turcica Et28A]EOA90865.1 hypothetical protein SETTUDRAFT_166726 [Exserohilum turcica Et28A]